MKCKRKKKGGRKQIRFKLTFSAIPESAGSLTSLLDMNALWIALQQLYLASIADTIEIVVNRQFQKSVGHIIK